MAFQYKITGSLSGVIKHPGVTIEGDLLKFDKTLTKPEMEALKEKMSRPLIKSFSLSPYKPTDEEIEMIRAGMADPDLVDTFGFYKTIASSDAIDMHRDKLGKKYQEALAKQYDAGRTMLFMHNHQMPIGATFAAKTRKKRKAEAEMYEGGYLTEVKFYITPESKVPSGNAKYMVDTGSLKRTSVSFSGFVAEFVEADKSEDGKPFYTYTDVPPQFTVHELSLVNMGANPDAILKSSFSHESTFTAIKHIQSKSKSMDLKKIKLGTEQFEVNEGAAEKLKEAFASLEEANQKLSDELEKFKAAEEKQLKAKREKYTALMQQLTANPTDEQIKEWGKDAEEFTERFLDKQLAALQKEVDAIKSKGQAEGDAGEADTNEEVSTPYGTYTKK